MNWFLLYFLLFLIIIFVPSVFSISEKYPKEVHNMLQEKKQFENGRGNRAKGTWSTWSSWSECSRSCGTGLQSQSRECISLQALLRKRNIMSENGEITSNAKSICIGTYKRYHTCNIQECSNSEDPRMEQCAKYNGRNYKGRSYMWIPFVDAPNSCALNCRPIGEFFYATLEPAVIDGTPCKPLNLRRHSSVRISTERNGERWLCVAGQCKTVGCDGVVGSGVTIDACGVCGGQNKECRLFEGIFIKPILSKGYQQVITIPKSAMSLNISELQFSSNFLALKDSNGSYILNGHWSYSPSGTYKAAGTTLTYQRGDRNRMECILATGPLNESLRLEILSVDLNPGVLYKYMLPVKVTNKTEIAQPLLIAGLNDRGNEIHSSDTRVTVQVPVTKISDQQSNLSLTRRDRYPYDGERKEEMKHSPTTVMAGDQPKSGTMTMKERKKKFAWKIVGYAPCSQDCGGGIRTMILKCIRENKHLANEKHCRNKKKPNNPPLQCNAHPCPPRWQAEQWSKCSVTCGVGIRTRKFQCIQKFPYAKLTVRVVDDECIQPSNLNTTEVCNLPACSNAGREWRHMSSQHDTPRWDVGVWGPCSTTCGHGTRNRTVTCITSGKSCSLINKPKSQKTCEIMACNAVTNMEHHAPWLYSDWSSDCSTKCGNGVKIRQVACADGSEVFCNPKEKPDMEMRCFEQGMNCNRAKWFIGPWTSCSVSCGVGMQHRDIACIARTNGEFVALSTKNCSDPKPVTEQICKISMCSSEWFTSNWSTCSTTCGIGVQTRLVRCLIEGISSTNCSEIKKPTMEKQCNMRPCLKEVSIVMNKPPKKAHELSECVDKYPNCALVIKNGLCRIKYYKHSCCQCLG